MKNPEANKSKENDVKFIKKVSPNKAKLTSRKENGKEVVVEKTVAMGCVPSGHDQHWILCPEKFGIQDTVNRILDTEEFMPEAKSRRLT